MRRNALHAALAILTGRLAPCALLAVLVAIAGCKDDIAGGNGTSTDNVVTARILSVDSIARDLPDGDLGPYPLLVRLDASTVDFDSSYPDGRDLRMQREDSTPLPFQLREWDTRNRRASLWVRLDYFRRGSGQSLRLVAGRRDSTAPRSDIAATWKGVSPWIRQAVSSLLLGNFEDGVGSTPLPCACNHWYAGVAPGVQLLLPAWGQEFQTAIVPAGDIRLGRALHISYSAPVASGWALAGTRLGTTLHRFAALDSITLWARGKGRILVALEDGRDTSGYRKAWARVALDTAWRRIVIHPSQFDPPDAWNIGWNAVRDSINTFSVFGLDGTDFWIDEVRLHGISPAEIR